MNIVQELEEKKELPEETKKNVPEESEEEKKLQEEIGSGYAKFVPKVAVPQTTYKPPVEVPPEKSGEGVNKKVKDLNYLKIILFIKIFMYLCMCYLRFKKNSFSSLLLNIYK